MSTSTTLSRKVDARLTAYTALAGAALASTAAMLPEAKADIIYSGPVTIGVPATTAGIYLNLATGQSTTTPAAGWDFNPWGGTNINFYYNTGGGGLSLDGTSLAVLTPSSRDRVRLHVPRELDFRHHAGGLPRRRNGGVSGHPVCQ